MEYGRADACVPQGRLTCHSTEANSLPALGPSQIFFVYTPLQCGITFLHLFNEQNSVFIGSDSELQNMYYQLGCSKTSSCITSWASLRHWKQLRLMRF